MFFPELRKGDRIKIIKAHDPKGNDIHAGKYGTVHDVPSYGGFEAKLDCGNYLIVPRAAIAVVEIEVLKKHVNTHRFSWKNYAPAL
jgi:hypothetical protein